MLPTGAVLELESKYVGSARTVLRLCSHLSGGSHATTACTVITRLIVMRVILLCIHIFPMMIALENIY